MHLATEAAVRAEHEPGDRDILVSYEAVRENLEHGTDTYNTVTYGDLAVEGFASARGEGWGPLGLKRRISDLAGRLDRRGAASRKRLERVLSEGGFDAEAGVSLEGAAASGDGGEVAGNRAWRACSWRATRVGRRRSPTSTRSWTASSSCTAIALSATTARSSRASGGSAGARVTVIAQEKGRDLSERIARNFGCPQPEGYRKSLRLMRQAEKFGRPVVCLVDTQGAFCGMEAEERGQGNAIADNLVGLAGLRVPVVSVLLGEGGSGGALALALADRVAMQEHAVYSVLSPEGFASILWKDRTRAPEAAAVMKMSAVEACEMGIVDAVLSEGARPAHENPEQAAASVRAYVEATLDELADMPAGELVRKRHERFAKF